MVTRSVSKTRRIRYPDKGYPQCLTYTYEVKGEQLKKELFHMGCGYNTLAFLGMVTPKQALAEIEKKSNVKVS